MSDVTVESLKKCCDDLTVEVNNYKKTIENFVAQLDASKSMFNEQLNSNLGLRTHTILLQREVADKTKLLEDRDKELKELKDHIVNLQNQLTEALQKSSVQNDQAVAA